MLLHSDDLVIIDAICISLMYLGKVWMHATGVVDVCVQQHFYRTTSAWAVEIHCRDFVRLLQTMPNLEVRLAGIFVSSEQNTFWEFSKTEYELRSN